MTEMTANHMFHLLCYFWKAFPWQLLNVILSFLGDFSSCSNVVRRWESYNRRRKSLASLIENCFSISLLFLFLFFQSLKLSPVDLATWVGVLLHILGRTHTSPFKWPHREVTSITLTQRRLFYPHISHTWAVRPRMRVFTQLQGFFSAAPNMTSWQIVLRRLDLRVWELLESERWRLQWAITPLHSSLG